MRIALSSSGKSSSLHSSSQKFLGSWKSSSQKGSF
jgi:hypothetical protein